MIRARKKDPIPALPIYAIHKAVEANHIEVLTVLIHRSADLNLKDSSGRTALIKSIENNRIQCCQKLLEAGASKETSHQKNHHTALHLAVRCNVHEIVQLLLEHGEKPESQTKKEKWTALHIACLNNDYKMIRILVDYVQVNQKYFLNSFMNITDKNTGLSRGIDPDPVSLNRALNHEVINFVPISKDPLSPIKTALHYLAEKAQDSKSKQIFTYMTQRGADRYKTDRKGYMINEEGQLIKSKLRK